LFLFLAINLFLYIVQRMISHNKETIRRHYGSYKDHPQNYFQACVITRNCLISTNKNPRTDFHRSGDVPVILEITCATPCPRGHTRQQFQAGFLTSGSSYLPRLPILLKRTVTCCGFCPRLQRRARLRFSRSSLLSS
jgi:hypothetical protein